MRTKPGEADETEGKWHIGKVELGTEIGNVMVWQPQKSKETFVAAFPSAQSNLLNSICV